MKKLFLCTVFMAVFTTAVFSQNVGDVVKMKNGDSYHGKIIGQQSNESITMKLYDGSIITFATSDIDEIGSEQTNQTFEKIINTKTEYSVDAMDSDYKKKGYFGFAEFESLISVDGSGGNMKVNIVNGYKVIPQFSIGAGVGINLCYSWYTTLSVPVFLHLRSDILNKKVTPYVALDLGYNFPVYNDYANAYEKGLMFAPKIGLGIKFSTRYQLNIGFGYSYNSAEYEGFKFHSNSISIHTSFIW